MSVEYLQDLERKDLEYKLINDLTSLSHVKGIKQEKSKITAPTQKMIDEFEEEHAIYNQSEGGKPLLNVNVPPPELDVYEPEQTTGDAIINPADKEAAIIEIQRLRVIITDKNHELSLIQRERDNTDKQYNRRDISLDIRNRILDDLDQIEVGILDDIERATNDIIDIETNLKQSQQVQQGNEQRFNEVQKSNKKKLNDYTATIKDLNREVYFPTQGISESDESYLERLEALKNVVQPDLMAIQAKSKIIKDFNEKMQEIIKNKGIINSVGFLIDNGENTDNRANLLQIFPLFKKRFTEIYGENNKKIDASTIADFILDMLENVDKYKTGNAQLTDEQEAEKMIKIGNIVTGKLQGQQAVQARELNDLGIENIEYEVNENIVEIPTYHINNNGNDCFFILYKANTRTYRLMYAFIPEKGAYTNSYKKEKEMIDSIVNRLDVRSDEVDYLKEIISEIPKKLKGKTVEGNAFYQKGKKADTANIKGWGVHRTEEIPKTATFGRFIIYPYKLFYDNLLIIRHPSGINIKNMNNVHVSDKFVDIMMELLKGKTETKEIQHLNAPEKELMSIIIRMSDLHKKVPLQHNAKQKLKEELDLVVGEIEAGNNNKQLYDKTIHILDKLIKLKGITKKEGENFLNSLFSN
jgi:hypothetical protein